MTRRWPVWPLAALAVAGCEPDGADPACPGGAIPVLRLVGAELEVDERDGQLALWATAQARDVDCVPAPPCVGASNSAGMEFDCVGWDEANEVVPEWTRLIASRPVRVRGHRVEAGEDLLAALGPGGWVYLRLAPGVLAQAPLDDVAFPWGRTRLTASWETDDRAAFSASASVWRWGAALTRP